MAPAARRGWDAFDAIVAELQRLESDETLLVQSGKPVGVFRTTRDAPRVLIANANLVPTGRPGSSSASWSAPALTMYGQMTAGSWIYIATQGIIQGTYETFAEAARQHFSGSLKGTATLTAGLGGMGGAQPLAVTMNEGACLGIEVDPARAERRHAAGYVDEMTDELEEAVRKVDAWRAAGEARSIALIANAADVEPELVRRGWHPDLVTDQTSAHDPVGGYVPGGIGLEEARSCASATRGVHGAIPCLHGRARAGHAGLPGDGGRCSRQQHPGARQGRRGRERLRLPWLRPGLHSAALLRGQGSLPLGRSVRATRGHPEDRRSPGRALPG